jgi:hypothetical protein
MPHLTLQEVIDRIKKNYPSEKDPRGPDERAEYISIPELLSSQN